MLPRLLNYPSDHDWCASALHTARANYRFEGHQGERQEALG